MKRYYIILTLLAVLLLFCNCGKVDLNRNEVDIYSSVINYENTRLKISKRDSVMISPTSYIHPYLKNYLLPDLIHAKNKNQDVLYKDFFNFPLSNLYKKNIKDEIIPFDKQSMSVDCEVIILNKNQLTELSDVFEFKKQYPAFKIVYFFSKIGFNKLKNKALVSYEILDWKNVSGAYLTALKKENNGEWIIVYSEHVVSNN